MVNSFAACLIGKFNIFEILIFKDFLGIVLFLKDRSEFSNYTL